MNNKPTVSYTFSYASNGYGNVGFPDEYYNLTFDGTDITIDMMVLQFEKLLRSAGYEFKHVEVVKSESY
jgi:hypothetical protein